MAHHMSVQWRAAIALAVEFNCSAVLAEYTLEKCGGDPSAASQLLRHGGFKVQDDNGEQRLGMLRGLVSAGTFDYEFELHLKGCYEHVTGYVRFVPVISSVREEAKAGSPTHGRVVGMLDSKGVSPMRRTGSRMHFGDTIAKPVPGGRAVVNVVEGRFKESTRSLSLRCLPPPDSGIERHHMPSLIGSGAECARRRLHVHVDALWLAGSVQVQEEHRDAGRRAGNTVSKKSQPPLGGVRTASQQSLTAGEPWGALGGGGLGPDDSASRPGGGPEEVAGSATPVHWKRALALAASTGAPVFTALDAMGMFSGDNRRVLAWLQLRRWDVCACFCGCAIVVGLTCCARDCSSLAADSCSFCAHTRASVMRRFAKPGTDVRLGVWTGRVAAGARHFRFVLSLRGNFTAVTGSISYRPMDAEARTDLNLPQVPDHAEAVTGSCVVCTSVSPRQTARHSPRTASPLPDPLPAHQVRRGCQHCEAQVRV